MDSVDGEPMKMLSDNWLDQYEEYLREHVPSEHWHLLKAAFAQAKLAYTIREKAAEICRNKRSGPDFPGFNRACDEWAAEILAMEIPENE